MGKSKTCVYSQNTPLFSFHIVSYHRGLDFFNAPEGLWIFNHQLQHLISTLITCFVMFYDLKIFEKRIVAIDYPHNYTPQTYTHAIKQIYKAEVYTMCIAQHSCSGHIDSSKVSKIYIVILQSKVFQPSTGFVSMQWWSLNEHSWIIILGPARNM